MLGFGDSQILRRFYGSPSADTINYGPSYTFHAKRSHTHVKDTVVHVRLRVWLIMETLFK